MKSIALLIAMSLVLVGATVAIVLPSPVQAAHLLHRWCSGEIGDPSIAVCWDKKSDCMKHYLRDGPCVKQKYEP